MPALTMLSRQASQVVRIAEVPFAPAAALALPTSRAFFLAHKSAHQQFNLFVVKAIQAVRVRDDRLGRVPMLSLVRRVVPEGQQLHRTRT